MSLTPSDIDAIQTAIDGGWQPHYTFSARWETQYGL